MFCAEPIFVATLVKYFWFLSNIFGFPCFLKVSYSVSGLSIVCRGFVLSVGALYNPFGALCCLSGLFIVRRGVV